MERWTLRCPRRTAGSRDRGEAVLEHVVLVPVVLLIVLCGVQAAVYFHEANVAELAAARAVAVASRHDASNAAGEAEAASVVAGSGGSLVTVAVSGNPLIEARVTLAVPRILPLFVSTVTRWRRAPEERYVPENDR
jgi:hypothetical protein